MSEFEDTIWCTGCGVEILYSPYVVNQQKYCCQDCALGFACKCGQAIERQEDFWIPDHPLGSTYPERYNFDFGDTARI